MRSPPSPARPRRRSSWRPTSPRSSRRPCRSAFPPTCCSAGPTSPRPSGRWRRRTRRSASPVPRSIRASRSVPWLGFETRSLTSLFEASSVLWSFGATVTQPLLSGGRLNANVDLARANYDATVANYRRVVLTAMQEVEDGITGLAALERADRQARTAVETARKVLELAVARYEGGATTLPRRHRRPAVAALGRAAGGAARRPAPPDLGIPDQGARRRLARAGLNPGRAASLHGYRPAPCRASSDPLPCLRPISNPSRPASKR